MSFHGSVFGVAAGAVLLYIIIVVLLIWFIFSVMNSFRRLARAHEGLVDQVKRIRYERSYEDPPEPSQEPADHPQSSSPTKKPPASTGTWNEKFESLSGSEKVAAVVLGVMLLLILVLAVLMFA